VENRNVGGGSEWTVLSSTLITHNWGAHQTPNCSLDTAAKILNALGVCSLCVCFCWYCCVSVCVHLDGWNAEHKFHVWDTIPWSTLHVMSRHLMIMLYNSERILSPFLVSLHIVSCESYQLYCHYAVITSKKKKKG